MKKLEIKLGSGFSLIELIIAISIIAVLSGISVFALNDARVSGRDAKRKADIANIASGFELYKADCNFYPNTKPNPDSSLTGVAPCSPVNSNVYIQAVPDDPDTANLNYVYTPRPVGCNTTGTCRQFCVWTYLENSTTVPAYCTNLCGAAPSCGTKTCNFCVTNP